MRVLRLDQGAARQEIPTAYIGDASKIMIREGNIGLRTPNEMTHSAFEANAYRFLVAESDISRQVLLVGMP